MTLARDVLELARWAPSGDNSQPWRFRLESETAIVIFGYDTSSHVVYDLDGWASHLSHGALLETLSIAASQFGCHARIELPQTTGPAPLAYRVELDHDTTIAADPLGAAISRRTVQRRPMRPRALTAAERNILERAAMPFASRWFESLQARHRVASLCAQNARIRLTIPEAYAVHRSVIAWNTTDSADRLPDAALGADPLLLSIMRRTMSSWDRVDRANRLGGTWVPRLELDYLPGILCSAYVALIAPAASDALADRIAAGRAMQRLWLVATALNLQMQPQYTPLVFARYAREGRVFTQTATAQAAARTIDGALEELLGPGVARRAVWLARIGPARSVPGRSLRLPLSELIVHAPPDQLPQLDAQSRSAAA
jgi:nitroreductase